MEDSSKFNTHIDDLSWSNIVNLVQGQETLGADLIANIATELKDVREEYKAKAVELSRLELRIRAIETAGKLIAKHLNKQLPLIVQRNKFVVIVSDDGLKVELNTI